MLVAAAVLIAAVVLWVWPPAGWVCVATAGLCAFFFRDPERVPPERDAAVVSPADGRIVVIDRADPPTELGLANGRWVRIGIFLSLFDVHVTRVPFGGTVRRTRYRPGRHRSATSAAASAGNERHTAHIDGAAGREVAVAQVAGLVARRVVCSVREGDEVVAGDRMGIIRFGSRVDLYVPEDAELRVKAGQTMIGGETVVAELSPLPPRSEPEPRA